MGWGGYALGAAGIVVMGLIAARIGEWVMCGWRELEARLEGAPPRASAADCPCSNCRRDRREPCSDFEEGKG